MSVVDLVGILAKERIVGVVSTCKLVVTAVAAAYTPSDEAAWFIVIVVVPAPTIVTNPADETDATPVLLLE